MKKKKLIIIIAVIAVFLLSYACGKNQNTEPASSVLDSSEKTENTNASEKPKEETPSSPENNSGKQEKPDSEVGKSLKVHFIDVGQADSILIELNGKFMLIDAGNNADAETVTNYLKNCGVVSLEYVIGTHPHEDHIGSLDTVIENFDVEKIIMPQKVNSTKTFEDVLTAIENKGLKITAPTTGENYSLGDAGFIILAPNGDYGDELNNWSVGIKLTYGKTSFVMCGDAEEAAEGDILKTGIDISANVLKIGHHGSSTSTSESFLNAVNPEYAVISVGEGNDYGHPHQETLDNLLQKGIKILRTDKNGTIIAESDGENISWEMEKGSFYSSSDNLSKSEYTKAEESSPAETASGTVTQKTETKNIEPEKTEPQNIETQTPEAENTKTVSYILNTSTKKFHLPSCASVSKIKAENYAEFFGSREEAISAGYEPCGNCKP
ncbi:MAG: MBL fold metallo-hydrolase [Lachnospiraceae bacterium]|nr:MBL fold metallo-hydrolase [Lachnospiraceae bacterium]